MAAQWVDKLIRLPFRLGEIPLFVKHWPGRVLNADPGDPPYEPELLSRMLQDAPSSVKGLLVRSQPVCEQPPRFTSPNGSICYVSQCYQRYHVDLSGTFEDYLKKFSSKTRSTLKRKIRKFSDHCGGQLDWRAYETSEAMETFMPLAHEVSVKTYQHKLLKLGLSADASSRRPGSANADSGGLRGFLLFCEGKPITFMYCKCDGQTLDYVLVGYDPDYARWSPGTVLHYVVLEHLFADQNMRLFDFCEGGGPHKEFFSTGNTQCADVYALRRTAGTAMLLHFHSMLNRTSGALAGALDKVGLKKWVKKRIRKPAA